MKRIAKILLINKEGQGLIEYALMISLVILVVVFALEVFGIKAGYLFENISEKISETL